MDAQELLRIAFSHPVNSAPDTEFEYCNTNTVLLGLIIEKLTGMSARRPSGSAFSSPWA